jgi:hypothetical protein
MKTGRAPSRANTRSARAEKPSLYEYRSFLHGCAVLL